MLNLLKVMGCYSVSASSTSTVNNYLFEHKMISEGKKISVLPFLLDLDKVLTVCFHFVVTGY